MPGGCGIVGSISVVSFPPPVGSFNVCFLSDSADWQVEDGCNYAGILN